MPKVTCVEVRCSRCERWFSPPMIHDADDRLEPTALIGRLVDCPKCAGMTVCTRRNLRLRTEGGGVVKPRV